MGAGTLDQNIGLINEDFTGSVCLLLPKGLHTLIDIDVFERLGLWKWQVMGRTIFHVEHFGRPWKTVGQRKRRRVQYGYAKVTMTPIHRFILRATYKQEIDHINRDPFDNRRSNLRLCTRHQNAMNTPKRRTSKNRFKGVYKVKGKERWTACFTFKGKRWEVGTFNDEVSAAIAYNKAVRKACGEFAYLNPIEA